MSPHFSRLLGAAGLACMLGVGHAADVTISASACATWTWSPDARTLTCGAAPQNGPASCSALTATPGTPAPGATFSLTATCSPNGGTISAYEFSGPVAQDGSAPVLQTGVGTTVAGLTAPATALDYYYRVRAGKPGTGNAATEWGQYFTQKITVSAASKPNTCTITPSSATTNVAQSYRVNCANIQNGATYSWTADNSSQTSCSNQNQCTITFATPSTQQTHAVSARSCNTAAPESCETAQQNVTVTDSTPPQTGNISCTNISGITHTLVIPGPGRYLDLDTIQGYRVFTPEYGSFTGATAVVVAFKTPSFWASTGGHAVIAEMGVTPNDRLAILSSRPCVDETGGADILNAGLGANAYTPFAVGNPIAGVPTLDTNRVYYVTYTNRQRDYTTGRFTLNSCLGSTDCAGMIDIKVTR